MDLLRRMSGAICGAAVSAAAAAAALLTPQVRRRLKVPPWLLWLTASIAAAITVNELVGKPVPFLRWSVLTMMLRGRHLLREWQVGDGRETALEKYVLARARPGDVDDAIRVIDHFGRHVSFLINVGDEKGKILDRAVERTQPRLLLELGIYCGYSALRMARVMPREARLYSVEFNTANAAIARRILAHAGVDAKVTVISGRLATAAKRSALWSVSTTSSPGSLDLVFLDHDKKADFHLPALRSYAGAAYAQYVVAIGVAPRLWPSSTTYPRSTPTTGR